MPFHKAQSVLKKILPERVFELLYRVATAEYYANQAVLDWIYYNIPRTDSEKRIMIDLIKTVLPHTMVGRGGLITTYKVVKDVERQDIEGCLVECGVARGGSAALMLLTSELFAPKNSARDARTAWLFDSFEGLPSSTTEDGFLRKPNHNNKSSWDLAEGYCLGALEEVEELLFKKLEFDTSKVFLIKGWFQDTLPEHKDKVGDIAVLRLDGDWYESTKCCLENLYDNVIEGGYVIVDDYALVGCRKAADEFLTSQGEHPEIIPDGRGGGWFKKKRQPR